MLNTIGRRGVTSHSLKAFKEAINKHIDFLVMVSYCHGNDTSPIRHGFVIVEHLGSKVTTITDGFASGYSGEGPRGLVDALKSTPPNILMFNLHVSESIANKLFDGELDRLQILDMFKAPKILKITWKAQNRASLVELDPNTNCLYITASRGDGYTGMEPSMRIEKPSSMAPAIEQTTRPN